MRKARGFAAMELLVVIAILGIFVALAASFAADRSVEDKRVLVAKEYVKEWPVLTRAVQAFVKTNAASFPVDTVRVILLSELTGAGLLPASFATRATGVSTTPLGHGYRIASIRSSVDGKTRTVISESGVAHIGRLQSLEYDINAGAPAPFKRHVAGDLSSVGLIAAYVEAGIANAKDPGSNGWTKDVSAWMPVANLQNSVAVLLGFPDLEPAGDGDGGNGGPTVGKCKVETLHCSNMSANLCGNLGDVIPAQVPVGRTEQGRWPHCIVGGEDTFYPVAQNSAVITLGKQEDVARTWTNDDCDSLAQQNGGLPGSAGYQNFFAQCLGAYEKQVYTSVYLNNGLQGQNNCAISGFHLKPCGPKQCIQFWAVTQAISSPTTDDLFVCE